MRQILILMTICAWAALAPPTAQGAVWLDPSTDSNWNNAANWDTGTVPPATDQVDIPAGTVVVSGNLDRGGMTNLSGSANLTVNGRLRNGSSGPGTFNMSDSAQLNQTGNYFLVGFQNYPSTFNQNGGTVNSTVDRGWFFSDNFTSPAAYNLTGGQLNVTLNSNSYNWGVELGKTSPDDLFLIDGGTANFTNNGGHRVYLFRNAVLRVKSGSATFSNFQYFVVGRDLTDATNYVAKFAMEGGDVTINNWTSGASGLCIGGGREGRFEMSGGKLTVNNGAMWVGDRAVGTAVQTGGDILLNNIDLVLSYQAASTQGRYEMSGGTLTARNILTGSGTGTKDFIFTGGTITLSGNKCNLIDQSWFTGADGTGAFYDASLDSTTIKANHGIWNGGSSADSKWKTPENWNSLAAPAAGATLIFDGAVRTVAQNDYESGTAFGGIRFLTNSAGFTLGGNEIVLAGDIVNRGSNAQTIDLGMTLSGDRIVNVGAADMTVSKPIGGGFSLTKAGQGILTLTADPTYTGNTVVQEGTLVVGNLTNSPTVTVSPSATLTAHSITADTLIIGSSAVQTATVPEPATLLLLAIAAASVWLLRKR